MVLGSNRIEVTEAELCTFLQTTQQGTEFAHVKWLEKWEQASITVLEHAEEPSKLNTLIERGYLPIVMIGPPREITDLWIHRSIHSVVVLRLDEQKVNFLDPLRKSETSILREEFFDLWARTHHKIYALEIS